MKGKNMLLTVQWKDDSLILIDQTKLPTKLSYVYCKSYQDVAAAIKQMIVRGAPAIGVAAAFGLVLAARRSNSRNIGTLLKDLNKAYNLIRSTRPTAINLQWGLDRLMQKIQNIQSVSKVKQIMLDEAIQMAEEDIFINRSMGSIGEILFSDGDTIMTHCNAGALATVAYGTALGVIRATKDSGKNIKVIATETRPVQQGSRLTAFELKHDGFDVSLIPDTAVGYSMANKLVNKVIVGADRVLKTGHVYNKIGTYQVALMAKQHNIPFYVAAPLSTFDMKSNPQDVIIEQRKGIEVTQIGDKKTAPDGVNVINPAFDMTTTELISGIITETGVAKPPFEDSIPKLFEAKK